jgi:hypothetical protein
MNVLVLIGSKHGATRQSGAAIAEQLVRAVEILELVDFTPAAVRADIAGHRTHPKRLYSAGELITHAADLLSDSAGLVHKNEGRWRLSPAGRTARPP